MDRNRKSVSLPAQWQTSTSYLRYSRSIPPFLLGKKRNLNMQFSLEFVYQIPVLLTGRKIFFFYARNPVELQETSACQTGFQFATPWQPVWRARRPSSGFSWWISVLVDPRVPVKVGNEQLFHLISNLLSFLTRTKLNFNIFALSESSVWYWIC